MESIYIIKKNGEMYWNLNTAYKHKSRAERSLLLHLETLVPKINRYMKTKSLHSYKEKTIEDFIKDFEIVRIQI